MARGAELAVFAGLFYFFGQILEDVAHDVGVGAAGVELAEKFINEADGALESVGLIGVEDEVCVAETTGDAAQSGVAVLGGAEALFQLAEPRENGVVEQGEGDVLADVGPAAFLEIGVVFRAIGRQSRVNGALAFLHALAVEGFKLPDEKQVGDLLDGNEWIGKAGRPEE